MLTPEVSVSTGTSGGEGIPPTTPSTVIESSVNTGERKSSESSESSGMRSESSGESSSSSSSSSKGQLGFSLLVPPPRPPSVDGIKVYPYPGNLQFPYPVFEADLPLDDVCDSAMKSMKADIALNGWVSFTDFKQCLNGSLFVFTW